MLRRLLCSTLLLALALCAGCVHVPAGMTSSTCPITGRDTYTEIGQADGRTSAIGIMGLVFSWKFSAWHAIQDAKRKSGADALIDVTADNKNYILPYISFHQIRVSGKAIKFKRGAGAQ